MNAQFREAYESGRAQFRSGYADGDEGEIGGGGEFPQPPPVLSAAAVSGVTKTSATPRVTLTF